MTEPDLLVALAPVLDALRQLGVRHFVGGSIASSAHGVPRASIDADVVAELLPTHAAPLAASLRGAYYVPEARLVDAIAQRASFSVIHLGTMVKVDVFVSRGRPSADGRSTASDLRPRRAAVRSPSLRPRTRCSPSSSGSALGGKRPNDSGGMSSAS